MAYFVEGFATFATERAPVEFLCPPQFVGGPQESIVNHKTLGHPHGKRKSPYAQLMVAVEPLYSKATA